VRVLCLGAGGAPTNGFCRSLKTADSGYHLIGANANEWDLELAETDEKHVLPVADDPEYQSELYWLLNKRRPDFIHAQNDAEVEAISKMRHVIRGLGCRYFLPSHQTIQVCRDKWLSYQAWRDAGIKVPQTWLAGALVSPGEPCWVRPRVGAGGKGAFLAHPGNEVWLDEPDGWTAAEFLPGPTVTVQFIFHDSELVVGQGRRRLAWTHGDRGSALVSETVSDSQVNTIAYQAVLAVDDHPHGIYGVDMAYDADGVPNPTEINIGRFFTTIEFFTQAGFNFPHVYVQMGMGNKVDCFSRLSPLPAGLRWIRGMDRAPVLVGDPVEFRPHSDYGPLHP
jgi:glutathione synthase/RimK-type ligase-like ATP-grasp enzyme